MESLKTNLEDLSEGGSQYVGHLKFEMISISLLSKYQIESIFHKCSFMLQAASTGKLWMLIPFLSLWSYRGCQAQTAQSSSLCPGLCGCLMAPALLNDLGRTWRPLSLTAGYSLWLPALLSSLYLLPSSLPVSLWPCNQTAR